MAVGAAAKLPDVHRRDARQTRGDRIVQRLAGIDGTSTRSVERVPGPVVNGALALSPTPAG
jgi:hypothetical protein